MKATEIKKAMIRITNMAKISISDAVKEMEISFKDWTKEEVLSKPVGAPVERFLIFKKGRTSVVLNYSDNIFIEMTKTTSRKAFWDYLNAARA